jgi:hypothetical protein
MGLQINKTPKEKQIFYYPLGLEIPPKFKITHKKIQKK